MDQVRQFIWEEESLSRLKEINFLVVENNPTIQICRPVSTTRQRRKGCWSGR